MNEAERYEHMGVDVQILYDEDPMSPRDADNLCEMHIYYRGYGLGDTQLPSDGLPDIECPRCDGSGGTEDQTCDRCEGVGRTEPAMAEWLADHGAIAAMPLFVYEHSGISIRGGKFTWLADEALKRDDTRSTNRFLEDSQGWDTSFVGVMFVTRERITELCGEGEKYRTPEFLAEAFESEISEYDSYLRGDVYGYVVGEDTPFEDSCWGLVGMEYATQEANAAAQGVAEAIEHEEREKAEMAARDIETEVSL